MDADLDLLCTAVCCTADDLLPEPPGNARRIVTDAEVVALCVAQASMGIPSDRRFLRVARKRLRHLFPEIPSQSAYFKRRRRLKRPQPARTPPTGTLLPVANEQAAKRCSPTRATQAATSPTRSATSTPQSFAPTARTNPAKPPLAPIRQRIESIFWTCKDLLTLERHGARTLDGINERILQRFVCLAACITLNHQLGRPSRALVDYTA